MIKKTQYALGMNKTLLNMRILRDPEEISEAWGLLHGGGGGGLLFNCVPMREQRTAKLTLNCVFDILKLIPLFTVPSQKVNLSSVVN